MAFFVGVVAVGVVLQTALLAGIFLQYRRTSRRIEHVVRDVHLHVVPLISKVQILVEDAQPRISSMLADTAEITRVARAQAQRVDRVVGEATDRLRMQLIHADQILTGALDTVEETSTHIRRTISRPLQAIVALVRGVQTGIDFYRGVRRPSDGSAETQDESLFI